MHHTAYRRDWKNNAIREIRKDMENPLHFMERFGSEPAPRSFLDTSGLEAWHKRQYCVKKRDIQDRLNSSKWYSKINWQTYPIFLRAFAWSMTRAKKEIMRRRIESIVPSRSVVKKTATGLLDEPSFMTLFP